MPYIICLLRISYLRTSFPCRSPTKSETTNQFSYVFFSTNKCPVWYGFKKGYPTFFWFGHPPETIRHDKTSFTLNVNPGSRNPEQMFNWGGTIVKYRIVTIFREYPLVHKPWSIHPGVSINEGTSIAGWFVMEYPNLKWMIYNGRSYQNPAKWMVSQSKVDDDWRYLHFRKPSSGVDIHLQQLRASLQ